MSDYTSYIHTCTYIILKRSKELLNISSQLFCLVLLRSRRLIYRLVYSYLKIILNKCPAIKVHALCVCNNHLPCTSHPLWDIIRVVAFHYSALLQAPTPLWDKLNVKNGSLPQNSKWKIPLVQPWAGADIPCEVHILRTINLLSICPFHASFPF